MCSKSVFLLPTSLIPWFRLLFSTLRTHEQNLICITRLCPTSFPMRGFNWFRLVRRINYLNSYSSVFFRCIFLFEWCPAPSLEGNTPVAHGVPQANPENDGLLWQFDLTCMGKPSRKTTYKRGLSPLDRVINMWGRWLLLNSSNYTLLNPFLIFNVP